MHYLEDIEAKVTRRGDELDIYEAPSAEDLARIEERGKARIAHAFTFSRNQAVPQHINGPSSDKPGQPGGGSRDAAVEISDGAKLPGAVKSTVVEKPSSLFFEDPSHTVKRAHARESLFRRRALGVDYGREDDSGAQLDGERDTCGSLG